MRRYHIQDREDYVKYNKLCGSLRGMIHKLSLLPAQDPYRARKEGEVLDKLYDMGILGESHSLHVNVGEIQSVGRRLTFRCSIRDLPHYFSSGSTPLLLILPPFSLTPLLLYAYTTSFDLKTPEQNPRMSRTR